MIDFLVTWLILVPVFTVVFRLGGPFTWKQSLVAAVAWPFLFQVAVILLAWVLWKMIPRRVAR